MNRSNYANCENISMPDTSEFENLSREIYLLKNGTEDQVIPFSTSVQLVS